MDERHKPFPMLYSLSRTGKIKTWEVWVDENIDGVFIMTNHGYIDGTKTLAISSAIQGKNIGRKNETTSLQQAVFEAESKHKKQLDRNYSTTIPTSTDDFVNIRPMLAQKYEDRKHNIIFPAYEQPKLNGVRCLAVRQAEGFYKLMSRGGKEYVCTPHLNKAIAALNLPFDYPLDGEIFHPDMTFEEISSGVKKAREHSEKLQFWIYDIAAPNLDFEVRLNAMDELYYDPLFENQPDLVMVDTFEVKDEEELMRHHALNSLKYEGTMVRNKKGVYIYDFRSVDLQKLKDFMDDEFEIIGGEQASGADEGTVVFRCKTKAGKEFSVRPEGSREQRKAWFEDLPNLIGKWLTVRFQNYSAVDEIPIFPVGIEIRDIGEF